MSYIPSASVVKAAYVGPEGDVLRSNVFDQFIRKVQADAIREAANRFISVDGKLVHDFADERERGTA